MTLRRAVRLALLAVASGVEVLAAQTTAKCPQDTLARKTVPLYAQALVVSVQSYFGDPTASGTAMQFGAGIIVGTEPGGLIVVTAAHVVPRSANGAPPRAVWVCFASQDSTRSVFVASLDTVRRKGFDIAVLHVPVGASERARWTPPSWNRQGFAGSVRRDDDVNPVGCPNNRCWQTPTPADRVSYSGKFEIEFQSAFVDEGSSGGALFNRSWEVIGMLVGKEPPHGRALRIDTIVAQLDTWRIARQFRTPSYPRGGYRTTLGAAVMAGRSGGGTPGHFPSGRVTLLQQSTQKVSWHVGLMRLAPENLAITAGLAGLDLEFRKGRFGFRPFAEAGFARMEGRHDLGGYLAADSSYVPFWQRVVDTGPGLGGGASLDVITLPRLIVEITGGYWAFTPPPNAPRLSTAFVGTGLRWAL